MPKSFSGPPGLCEAVNTIPPGNEKVFRTNSPVEIVGKNLDKTYDNLENKWNGFAYAGKFNQSAGIRWTRMLVIGFN